MTRATMSKLEPAGHGTTIVIGFSIGHFACANEIDDASAAAAMSTVVHEPAADDVRAGHAFLLTRPAVLIAVRAIIRIYELMIVLRTW